MESIVNTIGRSVYLSQSEIGIRNVYVGHTALRPRGADLQRWYFSKTVGSLTPKGPLILTLAVYCRVHG